MSKGVGSKGVGSKGVGSKGVGSREMGEGSRETAALWKFVMAVFICSLAVILLATGDVKCSVMSAGGVALVAAVILFVVYPFFVWLFDND